MDEKFKRKIRSFVRREGRITKGQQRALDELFPLYGISNDKQLLDLVQIFGRTAPKILEIGFGNGESLASMAAYHSYVHEKLMINQGQNCPLTRPALRGNISPEHDIDSNKNLEIYTLNLAAIRETEYAESYHVVTTISTDDGKPLHPPR